VHYRRGQEKRDDDGESEAGKVHEILGFFALHSSCERGNLF
jgi:hypothetical protein